MKKTQYPPLRRGGERGGSGPRERILEAGARGASDLDLLCAILGSGTASRRVEEMAAHLLEDGDAGVLGHRSAEELLRSPSFGPAQACRLLASIELGRRIWCRPGPGERPIRGPEDIQERCRPYGTARREHFLALHLNTRHIVVREELVSVGSLSASIVHPREVFRGAITESAASLILVHNHPSGDPTPSDDDISITLRLAEVGELVGIPIVDHVVLGDGRFYSFRSAKLLR